MSNLTGLTIFEVLDGLKNKKFSTVQLIEAYFKNMEEKKHLNAYVLENKEQALEFAKLSDERYANGTNRKLEGIPLGIKDLFCTKDIETTACSNILKGFVPKYESTVTQKLLDEGAIFLGKLNMDEFAMGINNSTSVFGKVINPNNENDNLIAGGSSGGSAVAVAAQMCVAATASDTGGSTRQPAAYCGVVGLKPTYGRVSRFGMIPYASSLDQAGVIARTSKDAALLLEVIAGKDDKDSTSADVEKKEYSKNLNIDLAGLKIAVIREYEENLSAEVVRVFKENIEELKSKGVKIEEISFPNIKNSRAAYSAIAFGEASSNLSRYDGIKYGHRVEATSLDDLYVETRTSGFGGEVKSRIIAGTYVLSDGYTKYYMQAMKLRRVIKEEFSKVFEKFDAILLPVTYDVAYKNDEKISEIADYVNDILSVPVNLAGLPAISFPAGTSKEGLPIGLQLIGDAFKEEKILSIASKIEKK